MEARNVSLDNLTPKMPAVGASSLSLSLLPFRPFARRINTVILRYRNMRFFPARLIFNVQLPTATAPHMQCSLETALAKMRRKIIIYCFSCFCATHTNCDFRGVVCAAAVVVDVAGCGFVSFCAIFFTSGVVRFS